KYPRAPVVALGAIWPSTFPTRRFETELFCAGPRQHRWAPSLETKSNDQASDQRTSPANIRLRLRSIATIPKKFLSSHLSEKRQHSCFILISCCSMKIDMFSIRYEPKLLGRSCAIKQHSCVG